jgi:hypothetical protein
MKMTQILMRSSISSSGLLRSHLALEGSSYGFFFFVDDVVCETEFSKGAF